MLKKVAALRIIDLIPENSAFTESVIKNVGFRKSKMEQ